MDSQYDSFKVSYNRTDLVVEYPLNHHQAPCNYQCLHRVGEGMRLVCPCHIGRGHQNDSELPLPG